MKNKLIAMGFCFVAIAVIIILFIMLGNNASSGGTRAGETYVGSESCEPCHNNSGMGMIYYNWEQTQHGTDFSKWDKYGFPVNKYTYAGGSCASCHVVGYNQTGLGGYDPAQAWNSSHNFPLLRIGCEACHGPGSAHMSDFSPDSINLGLDPYSEACSGTADAGCHGDDHQYGNAEVPGWSSSAHAPFDNDPADPGMNTYCAQCKSPSQWDPLATSGSNEVILQADWRGITCADCHDPHNVTANAHQLRWDNETICDVCHFGGYETMRTGTLEGSPSVDRNDYPYMDGMDCVECHMFNTPHGTPDEYAIQGHTFEPTIEVCVECHTDVYDNMPDDEYPHANWTAWGENLTVELEFWGGVVEAQQDRHIELMDEVDSLFQDAEDLKNTADSYGLWTEDLDELFEQTEYDMELADHQSWGAHNPAYAMALLNSSKANFTLIIEELSVGILKGEVSNSSEPIEGVNVSVNGYSVLTGSDGIYSLILPPGTYTVHAFKTGIINQSVSDVDLFAASITYQNFWADDDLDDDGEPDSTDPDDDNDGVLDEDDAFPRDINEWLDTDGDGVGDNADLDDDGDGHPDIEDTFPLDPTEWLDTDGDGVGDNADLDDDGDGHPDIEDTFPLDPTEWLDTDDDGIGDNADLDDDGDGHQDTIDSFPFDPAEWLDTDNDTVGNNADLDDDDDGHPDENDAFPLNSGEWVDTDNDTIGNNADLDDDDDGFYDTNDLYPLDPKRWRDEEKDALNSTFLLAIIVILIIIIAVLLLFLTRKKKAEPHTTDPGASEKEELPKPPPPPQRS
jgi:predicted CXXCH cytochrome family protein